MVFLDNDKFLLELPKLFQKSRVNGSVILTLKRYDGRTRPEPRPDKPPLPEPAEYMCLIRATTKNKKLSTVIHQRDVTKFQLAYTNLLKANLDGLKKLKKIKKSSKAATQ